MINWVSTNTCMRYVVRVLMDRCVQALYMQIVAIEIVIHLHNDDSVAATDTLSTAFGYLSIWTFVFAWSFFLTVDYLDL